MRGLTYSGVNPNVVSTPAADFNSTQLPPFDHPDPVIYTFDGIGTGGPQQLTLNALPQQITADKTIGVEVSREGAAPAFASITVKANNTTT